MVDGSLIKLLWVAEMVVNESAENNNGLGKIAVVWAAWVDR